MIQGITKEIDWAYVGALLANSGDKQQIEFFKSFVKECRSWGTNHQIGIQLGFVNLKLTDEEKETLSILSYKES